MDDIDIESSAIIDLDTADFVLNGENCLSIGDISPVSIRESKNSRKNKNFCIKSDLENFEIQHREWPFLEYNLFESEEISWNKRKEV